MASDKTFSDYQRIRVLWPDQFGLARGKYLPAQLADKGSAFCATVFGTTYDRDIIDAPGAFLLEGLKDVHATVADGTLRDSWEGDAVGVAVCDLSFENNPFTTAPREALQRALDGWSALGYQVKLGIELEGYLLEPDGAGGWRRFENPRGIVYGTGSLGDPSGFTTEVLNMAERCGFNVESCNAEFDVSQTEFTLRYDDAMTMADDAFLFRTMVREIALARGLDFTFLGKPFPEASGSGLHYNFSLTDSDGEPALADDAAPHGASELAMQCISGLVEHHGALTALCAPSINAYRRLQPGMLAGCWANWGVDHRNVTSRLPREGGSAMRIEHRLADGSVNIHLGAAAILQAARLGVVNNYARCEAYEADGFEDGGDGVERSAESLAGALDALEADLALVEAVGDSTIGNFVAHKRHEVSCFEASGGSLDSDALTSFELEHYLPFH